LDPLAKTGGWFLFHYFYQGMTVQFGYNKKEVMDGLRGHFIGRLEIRIMIIVINVFALLSFFLFAFKKIPALPFLFFAILWFTLWLSIRWLLPLSIYKKSATFKDNFVLSLTDQGVLLKTKKGNQLWRWEDFTAFKETIYFFHVYFSSRSFFMIPKDSFKDITEIQAARKLLKERIRK
jgi:YcxB-like protein